MFCSAECQSSRLHQYECGIYPGSSKAGYRTMRDLRCIFKAIDLFANVDELMDFVEQTNKSPDQLPATMTDEISQYYAYFKLRHCDNDMGDGLGICVLPTYKLAMEIAPIKHMFRMKKHERFLQHLIAHNLFINPESSRDLLNEYDQHSLINVMMCYFNHSCSPNLISVPSNGHLTFITARPIKKGDELFDSTGSRKRECCGKCDTPTAVCMCVRCKKGLGGKSLPTEKQEMYCDPNFKEIMAIGAAGPSKVQAYGESKLRATMDKCVMFLKEFGHTDWCNEIELVIKVYQELTRTVFRQYLH